ncbi:MAG: glutaredoxin [Gammaproteobacteria bacterium]|nr:glutaredoxin [Gammaproteobacteria bacterium]
MYKLEIYSQPNCVYCQMARRILHERRIEFIEYDISHDSIIAHEMRKRSDRLTTPQIFLNHEHIGGFDDMLAAIRDGSFLRKLAVAIQ